MNDIAKRFVAKQIIRRIVIPLAAAIAGIGVASWTSAIVGFVVFTFGLALVAGTYEKSAIREKDRQVAELFKELSESPKPWEPQLFSLFSDNPRRSAAEAADVVRLESWTAEWPSLPDFADNALLYCSLCGRRFDKKWLSDLASRRKALKCPSCDRKMKWRDIWVTIYKEL